MAHYRGLHHLAMATGDMDATVRFWRDLLGMRLVVGLGRPGYRHYFFEMGRGAYIAFFEWPEVRPVPEKDHGQPVAGSLIFDHVSIAVAGEDDLYELKERLDAAGFWVSEPVDHGFIHSIYSFDPNGVPIEFSCRVPDADVRRCPIMMDSSPSETTLEGPNPVASKWPPVVSPIPPSDRFVYPGEGRELVEGKKRDWWKKG